MTEPGEPRVPEESPTAILTDSRPTPDTRDDDREALELHSIQTHEDNELDCSTPSGSSGDEHPVSTHQTASQAGSRRRREAHNGLWGQICRFWTRHVIITVPQKSNRDHFALERTFLAYVRTSTVIAMQGVLVAQLLRLQRPSEKVDRLSFHEVGIPLSVACHFVAVFVALTGAFRFWRQQNAIARGKVYAGGWELNSVGILLFMVIVATLVLIIIISIQANLNFSAFPHQKMSIILTI
ncbi:Translation initiation factor IF-2 [Penicillium digitatum]|uniref:Translation initiation factor IF-2 n=1 Tax=Penicillium digitatum TaxID=36651 RepID=A0A7T6XFF0_PENDI|nr:Translation initiation factor IF-2 [Penicillium digitatum]